MNLEERLRLEGLSNYSPHGTRSRYKRGCRCFECRAANTEAQRRRRARIAASENVSDAGGYTQFPTSMERLAGDPRESEEGGYIGGYAYDWYDADGGNDESADERSQPGLGLVVGLAAVGVWIWSVLKKPPGGVLRDPHATRVERSPLRLHPTRPGQSLRGSQLAGVGPGNQVEVVFSGCGHIASSSGSSGLQPGSWARCPLCHADRVIGQVRRRSG